jgi:DnaJ-class molecular chaperone
VSGPQRTKSGTAKLEADCLRCLGTGETNDGICEACSGTRKVTLAKHHELVGLKRTSQINLETPIPPTDPDPSREDS